MIASFTNSFIFIKTAKTGGTSTEVVLSAWCADPDIVTPLSADEEAARALLGGRAMNYRRGFLRGSFHAHMPASKVRRLLPELWGNAFKFCVERHPYDHVVSQAHWRTESSRGRRKYPTFESNLERVLEVGSFSNADLYRIDGKVAVDEVILYEDLWPRLAELGERWGHELPAELPRLKFYGERPGRDVLSEAQKARIRERAAWEFDYFGFER